MDYYQKKFYLAQVDRNDQLIGPVERWQAHEKGILHRGFTVILTYNNQLLLQQRKHPVFDKKYDLSFSSHPIFVAGQLEPMEEAIFRTLKREWNLNGTDLNRSDLKSGLKTGLKYLDKIYYRAADPKSKFVEHEIDHIYLAEINKLPQPNLDFAYGYKLINQKNLPSKIYDLGSKLAPWVKKIVGTKTICQRLGW